MFAYPAGPPNLALGPSASRYSIRRATVLIAGASLALWLGLSVTALTLI
jgi:hypothetical protein